MSILGRHVPFRVIALVAFVLIVTVGALVGAIGRTSTRDITLVTRGMAFYLENDPATPNPTIEVKAGERVRIVLQNRDRGFTHDFAVPAFNAGLDPISWNEDGDLVLDVPPAPGSYEYVCRPHEMMMRGTIIIRE